VLARATSGRSHTGLLGGSAPRRFARKAVWFLEHNPDLPLKSYAAYLGAAVNVALAEVGCPEAHVSIGRGQLSAAAEFEPEFWAIVLNPDAFSHRPEVQTIGDLTRDEAALIAMTVYHEARHAEQYFRVARLLAARHEQANIDDDAWAAASASPLTARNASAAEWSEARAWYENTRGVDDPYREAVSSWLGEGLAAARVAHDVTDANAAEVRERIAGYLAAWAKPGSAISFVRQHATSARRRGARVIMTDVRRIDAAYGRAQDAFRALPERPGRGDFDGVGKALADLYRAVIAAYHDQPVEHDAFEAGDAVFEAFSALHGVRTPA
jgi:hypothetical protein